MRNRLTLVYLSALSYSKEKKVIKVKLAEDDSNEDISFIGRKIRKGKEKGAENGKRLLSEK